MDCPHRNIRDRVDHVACSDCGQKFGPLLPVDACPSLRKILDKNLDVIRRSQRLGTEAMRLGVRLEYGADVHSGDFGELLGVRKRV